MWRLSLFLNGKMALLSNVVGADLFVGEGRKYVRDLFKPGADDPICRPREPWRSGYP